MDGIFATKPLPELKCLAGSFLQPTRMPSPNRGSARRSTPSSVTAISPSSRQGLYDPSQERVGCGVVFRPGLMVRKSHCLVRDRLPPLVNWGHRGKTECTTAKWSQRRKKSRNGASHIARIGCARNEHEPKCDVKTSSRRI